MRTNPVMIYFGQELGEKGMDEEGFSGKDGRTTIFDYWSIDTIRRWRNGGKFDASLLTKEEKDLQAFYTKILSICNKEKAIREGSFFDIMYCNHGNQMMDENRQYAFLRKDGHDLILVVANFDNKTSRSWIKIPTHAFECMDIPVKDTPLQTKDLLTGKKGEINLIPDGTVYVEIPPYSGKILKIKI